MPKYESYEYKIDEIEVEIACCPSAEEPTYKTGYAFEILDVYLSGASEESGEWYDTYNEAEIACHDKIDELCAGKEPDYDASPVEINWEERRKLGE